MEIFSPPLIQAQNWQEAQRKFNEYLQQMARMLNQIYTGASIPTTRIADGAITIAKLNVAQLSAITAALGTVTSGIVQSADGKTYFDLTNGVIVISDGTYDRVVLGKQNSNYGGTLRDADGNITVDMGNLVRVMVRNWVGVLYGVNDVTKTTTGFADLDDMSFSLAHIKAHIMVYCHNRIDCNGYAPDTHGSCELQIQIVDHDTGGDVIQSTTVLNMENTLTTLGVFEDVAAGTHTIKARWNIGSNNQSWTSTARELYAMAFGTL